MIQTRIGMMAKVGGLWPITVVFLRDVFWTRVNEHVYGVHYKKTALERPLETDAKYQKADARSI
jgi:hypothetical protein